MILNESRTQQTQHAFLVALGWFSKYLGLPAKFLAVKLKQKRYHHAPQTKVLELLVATLCGLKYLQDISLAAHPLDKDQAVAEAWGQSAWADYSGVSRTMSSLSWEEVRQFAQVLDQVSQPYIDGEIHLLHLQGRRILLDGDLTGIPVSKGGRFEKIRISCSLSSHKLRINRSSISMDAVRCAWQRSKLNHLGIPLFTCFVENMPKYHR